MTIYNFPLVQLNQLKESNLYSILTELRSKWLSLAEEKALNRISNHLSSVFWNFKAIIQYTLLQKPSKKTMHLTCCDIWTWIPHKIIQMFTNCPEGVESFCTYIFIKLSRKLKSQTHLKKQNKKRTLGYIAKKPCSMIIIQVCNDFSDNIYQCLKGWFYMYTIFTHA